MKTYPVIRYALLSPEGKPQPCSRPQWRAWVDSPAYRPGLVREQLDGWEINLTFTGAWAGRGTPKFFTVWLSRPNGESALRQFTTYEEAWSALRRLWPKKNPPLTRRPSGCLKFRVCGNGA